VAAAGYPFFGNVKSELDIKRTISVPRKLVMDLRSRTVSPVNLNDDAMYSGAVPVVTEHRRRREDSQYSIRQREMHPTSHASEVYSGQHYSSVSGSFNDSAIVEELRRQINELQASLSDVRQRRDEYRDDTPSNNIGNHGYGNQGYDNRSWRVQARREEPKLRLPIFSGKSEWESFWIQFQLIATRYDWDRFEQGEQLLLCLKEEALVFASRLTIEVRTNPISFVQAMVRRFGDHVMPETHRINLQNIKRINGESMQEYASKVTTGMSKAYPGLDNTSQLYTELCIEHLLNGLQDRSLAYDVMTKKPSTFEAAVNMLTWHECCKENFRRKNVVRQLATNYSPDDRSYVNNEVEVRRVNTDSSQRFVTESRLEQFGRDLTREVSTAVSSNLRKNFKDWTTTLTEQMETLWKYPSPEQSFDEEMSGNEWGL
jgi:hypothetical protein